MRTPLLLSSFVAAMLFFTCTAAPASAGIPEWTFFCTPTPRVVLTTGAVSEGEARGISDDGRYVLFQAMFSGVPLSGVVSKSSFYVADLRTGQCVGMEGIGAECVGISDSGRIVFFTTRDALDPRDTNKNEDAYVWNLDTGAKELVALDIGGVCYPTSSGVTISGDGNWVVYTHGFDEVRPISIRNIRTGERALLSDDSGLRPAAISDDGSRILDDIGGLIGTKGASGWSWVKPDYGATNPTVAAYQWSISGDGTKVVFIDETGTSPFGMVFRDAFVYDITTQTKAAVPLANFGSNMVHGARVSDDGRFVSLVNDGVFVHDMLTHRTVQAAPQRYQYDDVSGWTWVRQPLSTLSNDGSTVVYTGMFSRGGGSPGEGGLTSWGRDLGSLWASAPTVHRFLNNKMGTHFYTASEAEYNDVNDNKKAEFTYEGIAYKVSPAATTGAIPVYRFLNKELPYVHFYTATESEMTNVKNNDTATWGYEGVAYYVWPAKTGTQTPVWRFFKPKQAVHFYTATESEMNNVKNNMTADYTYEGVAYYVEPYVAP